MITTIDEFEAAYREGLGRSFAPSGWKEVTEASIVGFGDGVGDYNPLWRRRSYAESGPYGALTAPPLYLYSINLGVGASIFGHISPGEVRTGDITMLYVGVDIEWHRPMWCGDRMRAIETPEAVEKRPLRQIENGCVCTARVDYVNGRQEQVATMRTHMLRFPNTGRSIDSVGEGEVDGEDDATYEGVAPDPLVFQRERRGSDPLYWDDVAEGEKLPDHPKGTYTTTELYLFSHGVVGLHRTPRVEPGTLDMGAGGRADPKYAQKHRAQASSFDWGPQRVCWLSQIVTDWAGDRGVVRKMSAQIRRPNLLGDTNTVTGEVVRRYREGDDHLVDVAVRNTNQRATVTAVGVVTVALPPKPLGA